MKRALHPAPLLVAASIIWTTGVARAEPSAAERARAEALFEEGRDLAQAGRFDEACPKFEESMRLDRAGGTQLNLARCREGAGKLASAWADYTEALGMARVDGRADREEVARERLAALEPKVPHVVVRVVGDPSRVGLTLDGEPLGAASVATRMPVDPGLHRFVASAPGKRSWETSVIAVEGGTSIVVVPELQPSAIPALRPSPRRETGAQRRSRGGQIGVDVRVDIDGSLPGAVVVPEITYGIGDRFELGAGPMIGNHAGGYVGGSFFLLAGAWKPTLHLGLPIFAVDGARPGVHGLGGLAWDPSRSFGFFAGAGFEYFPSVPSGYERLVFVPSLGVQGRL